MPSACLEASRPFILPGRQKKISLRVGCPIGGYLCFFNGGADRARTDYLYTASVALSQVSYNPIAYKY